MSSESLDEWVEEALQHVTRFNVAFVQLGAAYPAARDALFSRMTDIVDAQAYVDGHGGSGPIRVVDGVELLRVGPDSAGMGKLRERVIADRDAGLLVLLVSKCPRAAYPAVPGSSILRDAKGITPPTYSRAEPFNGFGSEATRQGVPTQEVVSEAVREMGEAVCAELDAFIFETDEESAEVGSLDESLQDALLSSGFVTIVDDAMEWTLSSPYEIIRPALADVIAGMRAPQEDLSRVAEHCWAAERLIKHALRARARVVWGSTWKEELFDSEHVSLAMTRAKAGGYAGTERVSELRDPLEWLTLGETLGLRESAASVLGSLGMADLLWKKLGAQLVPVKDRVDRSQLIRKGDVETARRWVIELRKRLSSTGSLSARDIIENSPGTQRELMSDLYSNLKLNLKFVGDTERDFMVIVAATLRFLVHTLDVGADFVQPFDGKENAPKEKALQDAFKAHLDMTELSGRTSAEASSIGTGRADVVVYFDDGARYVTEVKRELRRSSRDSLDAQYLPQTTAYQATNRPFGQLLVLDLTAPREPHLEHLQHSMWVTHHRDSNDNIISSSVVAVVRGNRATPSQR